jgi:2-polyprenyl-3-methyl-5-hydroxy-6-metoxy-1,4-benzoquinol methylase
MPSAPNDAAAAPTEYAYPDGSARWDDEYVWRAARRTLRRIAAPGARVFELGCGNGVTAGRLRSSGYEVTAVDPSESGIEAARKTQAGVAFHVGRVEDPLAERHGRFPLVLSLEVVEHCYSAQRFATCAHELLEPGGRLILSTPYHGYLKNLALAVTGRMDAHFDPLWEHGHIKFFSKRTISELLRGTGFEVERIDLAGRIAPRAKSMVVTARKRG